MKNTNTSSLGNKNRKKDVGWSDITGASSKTTAQYPLCMEYEQAEGRQVQNRALWNSGRRDV